MDRRDFLRSAGSAAVAAAWLPSVLDAQTSQTTSNGILYRTLGRTGEKVSIIGVGGYHIGKANLPEQDGIRIVRTALDHGINFLDNCWDYNDGGSEVRMGKALQDGYRQKAFLMTKIDGRTRDSAAKQIDESLARLQTDHVDLMQFHEVIRLEDPDRIFAPGGAMEAMQAAKQAGKVRYIGFTGHKDPLVHLRMLEVAKAHNFHFDAVQMPLNVMDVHFRSFGHQVVPVAVEQGIGVLGMKAFGDHYILDSKIASPLECLQFPLNMPISVQITGIDSMEVLDQALQVARTFKPLTPTEMSSLLGRTREAAEQGTLELYKTTNHFDGTAHNPHYLG